MAGRNANQRTKKIPEKLKSLILYGAIGFFALLIFISFSNPGAKFTTTIPFSQAVKMVQEGKVAKIEVAGDNLTLSGKNGDKLSTRKEPGVTVEKALRDAGIDPTSLEIDVKDAQVGTSLFDLLINILPVILMIVFFYFIFRQARGAGDAIFSFGKSKAKLFAKETAPKISFKDVAGVDEAKRELSEVVEFLREPEKFRKLGARIPKGVLLVGPAGVGKTLMARALAGEAKVPFFSMAGSEFMEMLVGVGASVTGETPILVRDKDGTRLAPIGEYIDSFFGSEQEGYLPVMGAETLGFAKRATGFWGSRSSHRPVFSHSCWSKVKGVFRHQVSEIYEIHYLGGVIKTTGDHSIFVRRHGGIEAIKAENLKEGDLLVELPLNFRHWDRRERKTVHEIKAHAFAAAEVDLELDFWDAAPQLAENYQRVLVNEENLSQSELAQTLGVSQATVGNWQRGKYLPQGLSRKLVKLDLPLTVRVTPSLMKLLGYYTAEGRGTGALEITFGVHETDLIEDFTSLMAEVFGLEEPVLERTVDNTVRIKYYSRHLGRFFARYCGNGSHQKQVPAFIWDLPKEYFYAYLSGYSLGDGYQSREGKLVVSSVSHRLIQELTWLCALHGIAVGVEETQTKEGRVIGRSSKPVSASRYWRLTIGKTSNPFYEKEVSHKYQIKRAKVQKIVRQPYAGYVYDLCGCDNEAFFGGEKPILLHNSRVRDLFETAKKNAPAIIFIDEVESIGRQRGMGMTGGHDEREQTLNQILVEMDGFSPNTSVIVVAATNRPDLLDPALVRPGRFDRRIVLELPDLQGREETLKLHMHGKPVAPTVNFEKLARRTVGFSGADLENMLNEAAILAARLGKKVIDETDLEEAATKVKMGPEKHRLQSEKDRELTAYHEAGHAIVAWSLPQMDPVHRVSIVARGMALGFTMIPPTQDRYNETKSRLMEQMTALLGGRAAEELVFNEFSAGAGSDIAQATGIARRMVTEFGMSELGPIYFPEGTGRGWLSPMFGEEAGSSEALAAKVDEQMMKLIDGCYLRAREVLAQARAKLDLVAKALVEKETLEGDEFLKLLEAGPAVSQPAPVTNPATE